MAVRTALLVIVLLLVGPAAPAPEAQGTAPAVPFTLLSREGRRPVPTTILNGQELIAVDTIASLFQVAVREDAGGLALTYRGRTAVLSQEQPMASVNGRVVSLPAPPVRVDRRWFVPLDVIPRALAQIYDSRLDLRRQSRLLIVGDLRVPRVNIRLDAAGPPTRATMEISPATATTSSVDGGRIIVRLDADAIDLASPPAGGLIESIRSELPSTVAIVLSPRAGLPRATATTSENMTRVAIDIALGGAGAAVGTPGDVPPSSGAAVAAPVPAPRGPAVDTVVIDPGHGGDDTGARAGDAFEKQFTLAIAQRLKALLEARIGVRVVLTREDDRALTADERAAVANNSNGDLFVSVHMNAAFSSSVAGAEVFAPRLDPDAEAAVRAAPAGVSLPVLSGGSRTIDIIRWDFAQARHVDTSAAFAAALEEELRKQKVPMGERPLQRQRLRVLAGVNMPAVLLEAGYLTNAAQAAAVRGDEFQNRIAQALFESVVRMRGLLDEGRRP